MERGKTDQRNPEPRRATRRTAKPRADSPHPLDVLLKRASREIAREHVAVVGSRAWMPQPPEHSFPVSLFAGAGHCRRLLSDRGDHGGGGGRHRPGAAPDLLGPPLGRWRVPLGRGRGDRGRPRRPPPVGLEAGEGLRDGAWETTAGGGDTDGVELDRVTPSARDGVREAPGDLGAAPRARRPPDGPPPPGRPALRPDARSITVLAIREGTRGSPSPSTSSSGEAVLRAFP